MVAVLLIILTVAYSPVKAFNCSASSASVANNQKVKDENGHIINLKPIRFEGIPEGGSACFLRDEMIDGMNLTLQYRITVESVTYTYDLTGEYEFVTLMGHDGSDSINPTCTCTCPTINVPNCPKAEECGEDEDACFVWKSKLDHGKKGCFWENVPVSAFARACCTIRLGYNETYTTYKITKTEPDLVATINTMVLLHGSDHILQSKTCYMRQNGRCFSDESDLNFPASMTVTNINARKVEFPEDQKRFYSLKDDDIVLVTETLINSKRNRELDKLGWLRLNSEGLLSYNENDFSDHFSLKVTNCAESEVKPKFTGIRSPRLPHQSLQSRYANEISSATKTPEGKVVIRPVSPTVDITITQESQSEFVLYTDLDSKVTNFTAILHTDKNSNRYLKLTLNETCGFLKGTLTAGNKTRLFQLLLEEGTNTHQEAIAIECVVNDTEVCLEAIWPKRDTTNIRYCSEVECETVALETAESVNDTVEYTKGEKDSLVNPRSWLKYANPAEWFNGVDSAAEGFIIGVVIVAFIIVLAVTICIGRCLCCFYDVCRCLRCGEKKRDKHKMFPETDL